MNVLIPYDADTTGTKNPFLFLLMRELNQQQEIGSIKHGYGWLYEEIDPDIIHLHWPELLVKSRLADLSRVDLLTDQDFSAVIEALERKKSRGAKVTITIHNERPHGEYGGLFRKYFENIYSLCDAFIHMGYASENLLKEQYPEQVVAKPSFIIPHGDYKLFPDEISRGAAREKLNIENNEKVILSFGAIRSKRELELGIRSFKQADISNSIYIMAGRLPEPYKSRPQHFSTRKLLYANFWNNKIRTQEAFIAPSEVQMYLKSADLLFIPRFNTLNSGNVSLGFTFGKVVAGPDYGVIGEVLKETGNPVFNPNNISSVSDAIRKGTELAAAGHGKLNRDYADKHMSWSEIAKKTVQVYKSLL